MHYSPYSWFLLAAALLAAPRGPVAQQFVAKRHDDLPRLETTGPWSSGAKRIDLGADGDQDILFADAGFLENLGVGRFVERPSGSLLGPFGLVNGLLVGDVDADGDDDVVVLATPIELWTQEAGATFRRRGVIAPGTQGYEAELLDLDGDGDLDLVRSDATLWRNEGTLPFADASSGLPVGLASPGRSLVADLDGDGDTDLVYGLLRDVRVLLNDGGGRFVDHTPAAFPAGAPLLNRRSLLGDFDGDGDVDLMHYVDSSFAVDLVFNDGGARFTSVRRTEVPSLPANGTFAVFDADANGTLDLAISGEPLWNNDGTGRFSSDPQRRAPVGGMLAGDFDEDGDVDLFASPVTMAWNERNQVWATPGESLTHGAGFAYAIDAEGDGDLDLVASSRALLVNDGRGHFDFPARPSIPELNESNHSAVVADFDGDGRPDILLGAQSIHLWTADGRGGFTSSTTIPVPTNNPEALFAADVDADGDLDAVFSSSPLGGGPHRIDLLRNDGSGRFQVEAVAAPVDRALRAFADLDGDGDPDLLTADAATWRNDGSGGFTPTASPGLAPLRAEAGDLDGDGDLDLFTVAVAADVLTVQTARNDGLGRFVVEPLQRFPEVVGPRRVLRLSDIDLDGDFDAVLVSFDAMVPRPTVLLLNEGRGPQVLAPAERTGAAFLGGPPVDVDGDGDPDFFSQHEVVENRHLQLASRRTARVGGSLVLGFAWQPGYGAAGVVAVAWIGPAALDVPRPIRDWGLLRLDPAASFDLPVLALGAAGEAWTEVPIPAVPALAGVTLHAQALFAPSTDPSTWRLSGLVRERILR